jgi:periplasmic protein TonB
MSAQHSLRLPAAFATSAAIHVAVLALVLRAASSGAPFVGPPEAPPEAKLIKVSLVSKPGGGGGGPLPGLPSAPKGEPGAPDAPPLPRVRLEPPPPAVPQPAAVAKPVLQAPRLPGPVRFPTVVAGDSPKAPSRPTKPPVAAAPAPPPPAATATGNQVASLGSEAGRGGGAGTGNGHGGGGEGTGDASGGDGSDGLARPAYGSNPKPPYPLAARRLGVEGVVMLEVLVRPDGSPADVRIRTSSGSALLDDSAVETVRSRWRFIPARRGNAAVESRVTFPIRFRLDAS